MSSLFNTLHVGYSGLKASQVGVSTTSHNIANAESEGYTRQRVVTVAATPLSMAAGNIGNGVEIANIARIFDKFVFDRYTELSADKEFSDFTQTTLEELSTYFPEIENVGIKSDLQEYYVMWQSFSDNPDNNAMKLALAKQTEILAQSITNTQEKVLELQSSINNQLVVNIDEINILAKELASVNKSIVIAESGESYTANDLRDKKNLIEKNLARLIGAESHVGKITSNIGIDSSANETSGSYTLSIGGFNIVDGATYHPIHINNNKNENGFYELSYERQDGVLISIEENINGGKVGAILNLRGSQIDNTEGIPSNGILQNVVSKMDAFASTLIESTNNLYASTSVTKMETTALDTKGDVSIVTSSLNVKTGSFDIIIYDIDGNIASRKTINIDELTVMTGVAGSNSIEGQMILQSDDNSDGNANNDVDDFMQFNWATFVNGENALELVMDAASAAKGYKFSIEDNFKTDDFNSGSNFAGALGLSRFFDGNSAKNIKLNNDLSSDPTLISAGSAPISGDNQLSLNIIQQQFEVYKFDVGKISYESTIYGMFDVVSTDVGIVTNEAILNNQSITAQFNATELNYSSVSKVSIDEELTNLIKYQTSYGAASKIITTIDQMMQTLLGIKQ
jgi:flagellar hook-associated protein 1 FlgK